MRNVTENVYNPKYFLTSNPKTKFIISLNGQLELLSRSDMAKTSVIP